MADGSRQLQSLWHKSAFLRYAFAVLAALAAVMAQVVLTDEWEVSVYSVLVGAVALAVWYGGVGPGIVGLVIAWTGAAVFVVGDRDSLDMTRREAWVQWTVGSRRRARGDLGQPRPATRARPGGPEADVAHESVAGVETLQRLSSALSAAASVSDVVSTLVEEAPPVVGAPLALGFVEEGDIVIAHPEGLQLAEWQVLRLTEGRMLHRTASQGRPLRAVGRAELEATFPGYRGARAERERRDRRPAPGRGTGDRLRWVRVRPRGGCARRGRGPRDRRRGSRRSSARARAAVRAELESRRGLDRILRVAPRFFAGSESVVTDAICREARTVFGADVAMLWRVKGDRWS